MPRPGLWLCLVLAVCGVWPAPAAAGSAIEVLPLTSAIFGNTRSLRVWLPPGYRTGADAPRYPVIYLTDGQNLFDAETAVFGGREWGLDETLTRLVAGGWIPPVVAVGIDNAGRRARAREYLPYVDEYLSPPEPDPQGELFDEFLTTEVFPLIEQRYAVATTAAGRIVGGSSYGALAALHAALADPSVATRLLLESPSLYVAGRRIFELAAASRSRLHRVHLGVGTNELALEPCAPDHPGNLEPVRDVRDLAELLRARGGEPSAIRVVVETCAIHREDSWARRLPAALEFLLSARDPLPQPAASSSGLRRPTSAAAPTPSR